jgi:hypothetical protein
MRTDVPPQGILFAQQVSAKVSGAATQGFGHRYDCDGAS